MYLELAKTLACYFVVNNSFFFMEVKAVPDMFLAINCH